MTIITVAIPVRDGGALLDQVLAAVRGQRLDPDLQLELIVCDSGSSDGSAARARALGAEVIEIDPSGFSHGGTRNLLMERAAGAHVAFLTQDAVPADDRWLSRMLSGFDLAEDVGIVFGPYLPRPGADPFIARELHDWFGSLAPDGSPRVDRLAPHERGIAVRELLGARGYFTDANACIAREAWERVPFRPVPYAEDHALAHDMLRAGFAKAFLPEAGVVHSHDYSVWEWFRRSFDEARAIRDVYGYAEPLGLRRNALKVWGSVRADWRWHRASGAGSNAQGSILARSAVHHSLRLAGAVLGGRAGSLPAAVVRRLSLEGRGG
jgi:rhamnosyltransferase